MPNEISSPPPCAAPKDSGPPRKRTAPATPADHYPRIAPAEHEIPGYVGLDLSIAHACAFGALTGTAFLARAALKKGADTAHVLEEVLRTVEALNKRVEELESPLDAPSAGI
jgi:hypothetical protein